MKDTIAQFFSGIEIKKRRNLFSLMREWKEYVSNSSVVCKDGKKYRGCTLFSPDGFFPGYYKHELKVLFMAREARGDGSVGYDLLEPKIKEGIKQLNKNSFWKRMLCMYNIIRNNGKIDENITAVQIFESMRERND